MCGRFTHRYTCATPYIAYEMPPQGCAAATHDGNYSNVSEMGRRRPDLQFEDDMGVASEGPALDRRGDHSGAALRVTCNAGDVRWCGSAHSICSETCRHRRS